MESLHSLASDAESTPARSPNAREPEWSSLDDLAPLYDPDAHGVYLRAVVEGVESHRAANIAVSGSYGSGKSSILDGLRRRYGDQIAEVSLATVRGPKKKASRAQVNDLQKEIVKQFLYVLDPAKVPSSRFSRASRFRWGRAGMAALALGAAAVAVQWLVTVMLWFAQGSGDLRWNLGAYVPTFAAVALLAFIVVRTTNGRWIISDVAAGPAKLTLSKRTGSYFDEYLDEIVYFFQASRRRIVIFEDMDRFNNVEVFEDLRALNVLLNRSSQLDHDRLHGVRRAWRQVTGRGAERADFDARNIKPHHHDGPIVFIYAIRDSLFGETVKTTGEVAADAFGRTKFFDLIVPVVPFVTQQNARGALKTELDKLASLDQGADEPGLSDELVRSIAQYFPDQRQIRNIRNEYTVYRSLLLRPGRHPKQLTPDRLLALVLYKNYEVADFEKIRLGSSKLHTLLKESRDLVASELKRVNRRIGGRRTDDALEEAAREVGDRVYAAAAALNVKLHRKVHQPPYSPKWEPYSKAELQSLQLWRDVVAGTGVLHFDAIAAQRSKIETGFGVDLEFAETGAAPPGDQAYADLLRDRTDLEQATWAKLWNEPKFVLRSSGPLQEDKSRGPETARSFRQIVVETLGEGLTADLIAKDLLTQNFALLSASFDTTFLSVTAQDFLTRVLEQPGRRHTDNVSAEDVGQIIEERKELILERSGMVNIHVLDYVLVHLPDEAHRILAQLRDWSEEDASVIRDYFVRYGDEAEPTALNNLVRYLAGLNPELLEFVATETTVPEGSRERLFDVALSSANVGELSHQGRGRDAVVAFAKAHQHALLSLGNAGPVGRSAARALAELQVRVEDLSPVSEGARKILVRSGMFVMSMRNLRTLVCSDDGWVSLEQVGTVPELYDVVLQRIDEYLDLAVDQESPVSAVTSEALLRILGDLAGEQDASVGMLRLRTVARLSAVDATVSSLADLSDEIQDALLYEGRARFSTSNLIARFEAGGMITESVAHAVSVGDGVVDDVEDCQEFVDALVTASARYPDLLTAEVIVDLVDALEAVDVVAPEAILNGALEVATGLIDRGFVEMDALRAAATVATPWPIIERVLAEIRVLDLAELLRLVTPERAVAFVESAKIPERIREAIVDLLDAVLVGEHRTTNAKAIAQYLVASSVAVSYDCVVELAKSGADASQVLELATREPGRAGLVDEPRVLLEALGGSYAAVVHRGERSPEFEPTPLHQKLLSALEAAQIVRARSSKRTGELRIRRTFAGEQ